MLTFPLYKLQRNGLCDPAVRVRAMRASGVVLYSPVLNDPLHIRECEKSVLVAVEALDVAVFDELPRADEDQRDTALMCPHIERPAHELGAVVTDDARTHSWPITPPNYHWSHSAGPSWLVAGIPPGADAPVPTRVRGGHMCPAGCLQKRRRATVGASATAAALQQHDLRKSRCHRSREIGSAPLTYIFARGRSIHARFLRAAARGVEDDACFVESSTSRVEREVFQVEGSISAVSAYASLVEAEAS